MLTLDNMGVLRHNYRIRRVKKNNNGILQDIPDAPSREIREFILRKGSLPGGKKPKIFIGSAVRESTKKIQ